MRHFSPFSRAFGYILAACFLLSSSGSGQMSPRAAANLQSSVDELENKIAQVQALPQGSVAPSFLPNLTQLRDNLRDIQVAANAPGGQLDVATIGAHLHHNLRQSAFTDAAGQHNAGVLPAVVPQNPFQVNSGKSSFGIFRSQPPVAGQLDDIAIIPLHSSVNVVPGPGPNPPITAINVINGLQQQVNGLQQQAQAAGVSLQWIKDNIATYAKCFSNNALNPQINVRQLNPGEVLVRCSQNGSREPGSWWVLVDNMPLSIADVRNRIAVLPNWNQNGSLEFFVVPEGCNMIVLDGIASAQRLPEDAVNTTPGPVWTAAGGIINDPGNPIGPNDPRSIPNPVWDPTFHSNRYQRDGIKRSSKFLSL
jgi:hypothetical protein